MKIDIEERVLHFKQPAGTSRGVYTERRSWFVSVSDGSAVGVGECAPLPDLSCDARPDYADILRGFCDELERTGEIDYEAMRDYPSMLFGLETALRSLHSVEGDLQSPYLLFDTPFSRGEEGIPINGLVWMGNYEEMLARMEQKLEQGFRCVKLKIGAIDFQQELELLSQYAIHSIEQPIKAGQWAYMSELCRESPLPIALDEELIGVNNPEMKRHMLNIIRPRYIILKPSLHGGMMGCREWISIARDMGIGSWITSALESNIGLNAIAQFASDVYGPAIRMPQGLGTGQLFIDNIPMPLEIRGDKLWI